MRIEKWALVAALVLSASPALAANGAKGDWELGGFGGHGWLDDYRTIRPRNDLLYGARLGYFLSPQLSLEVSAQRLPTDTRTVPSHSMNINSYRGNALFSLVPGSRWQPFLTAGGGYENTDYRRTVEGVRATRQDDYFFLRPAVDWSVTDWFNIGLFYEFSRNLSRGEGARSFHRDRVGVVGSVFF